MFHWIVCDIWPANLFHRRVGVGAVFPVQIDWSRAVSCWEDALDLNSVSDSDTAKICPIVRDASAAFALAAPSLLSGPSLSAPEANLRVAFAAPSRTAFISFQVR
jgi:hypothetical protein